MTTKTIARPNKDRLLSMAIGSFVMVELFVWSEKFDDYDPEPWSLGKVQRSNVGPLWRKAQEIFRPVKTEENPHPPEVKIKIKIHGIAFSEGSFLFDNSEEKSDKIKELLNTALSFEWTNLIGEEEAELKAK